MAEQTIIAIGREYGSAGHEIAERIARDFELKLYDRSILEEIASHMNTDAKTIEKYDEQPRNVILSRRVGQHTNSMEEILAQIQFEFIRQKAQKGESFVIVGRCAESVLKGTKGLITIFVSGNKESKLKRVMEKYQLSEVEAMAKMIRHDKKRKQYHNLYSEGKWGDSRYYDMCINSSPLGVEGTIKILEDYIKDRINIV